MLTVGIGLFVAGVALAAFASYRQLSAGFHTDRVQHELRARWQLDFGAPGSADRTGPSARSVRPSGPDVDAVAVLYAPRLGDAWAWVVVEGVDEKDLMIGPGHYPDTAAPGHRGNFAVAGHRVTHGKPFAQLDRLRIGDRVVAQTRQAWHVYRVQGTYVSAPGRSDLLAPVPGRPGAVPTDAYLTLTTCHPRWGSSERLVVIAELDRSIPREQGPPDFLDRAADPRAADPRAADRAFGGPPDRTADRTADSVVARVAGSGAAPEFRA